MAKLCIGTAGIPESAPERTSQAGIRCLKELGLDCMEMEFVRSVRMKERGAETVRQTAEAKDVALTVHAPYYVNLNSREKAKVEASKERILQAARIGYLAGAESVTFHAAFYHDDDPEEVYKTVAEHLQELRTRLNDEGNTIDLRPETTGSVSQFGTVEEIIRLSAAIPGVLPCVDFSHLFARSQGAVNHYDDFAFVLQSILNALGPTSLQRLHMHLSGIEYGPKGERKHVALAESSMAYTDVLKALIDFGVGGWLVCESPILEKDALVLQNEYRQLQAGTEL